MTVRRRKLSGIRMRPSVDAALSWVGAMRYPREMGDDAARAAAIAWCREVGIVGPQRDTAIEDFLRHARSARNVAEHVAGLEPT